MKYCFMSLKKKLSAVPKQKALRTVLSMNRSDKHLQSFIFTLLLPTLTMAMVPLCKPVLMVVVGSVAA